MSLERSRYRTTDADEAHAFIASSYTRFRPSRLTVGPCEFSVTSVAAPELTVHRLRGTLVSSTRVGMTDQVTFTTWNGGRCRYDLGRRGEWWAGRGDSMMFPLGEEFGADWEGFDMYYTRLPQHEVRRVASSLTGLAPESIRFEPGPPLSRRAARQLATTAGYVARQLQEPAGEGSPLLLRSQVNLVVATMLDTLPNSTLTTAHRREPGRIAPAALRRAIAYIDANAAAPITAADVAEAAGVTVRALQLAFERHHDTTPLGYLRRVRMQLAHRELQEADPAGGDTVARIATRWGWSRPDRFSAAYRAHFGVPPSHTLRG